MFGAKICIVSVIFTTICSFVTSKSVLLNNSFIHPNIPEDGWLDFPGLARKYGLRCEEHEVTTEDGYILTLFHVPASRNPNNIDMLLMHGILDTCETFLIRGEASLVFDLSESGYEVWVGNFRGNRYARRHVTLDPDTDKKFWDYSFAEEGYYDYAAYIDYILDKTGRAKVNVIGHSMGTSSFFILASTRPEYNDKVNLFIGLSPIAFVQYFSRILIDVLNTFWPTIDAGLALRGKEEISNENSTLREFVQLLCTQDFGYELCLNTSLFSIVGHDHEQIEPDFWPIIMGRFLDATSRKLVNHMKQLINEKRFAQFDYGPVTNLIKYGSLMSTEYDLSEVKTKVVLMVGENDHLGPPEQAERLMAVLPNAHYFMLPRKEFNHIDFVWAKDMPTILFPYIHNFLKKYV